MTPKLVRRRMYFNLNSSYLLLISSQNRCRFQGLPGWAEPQAAALIHPGVLPYQAHPEGAEVPPAAPGAPLPHRPWERGTLPSGRWDARANSPAVALTNSCITCTSLVLGDECVLLKEDVILFFKWQHSKMRVKITNNYKIRKLYLD